jgi:hypothetical protein
MLRVLRASVVAAACAGTLLFGAAAPSCTTFNGLTVPAGTVDAAPEIAVEAAVEAAPEAGPTLRSLASMQDAARVCALAATCPYLSPSLQASNAVPADPSNFSLCMHWLAGPFPPDRLGYALQQQAVACMANATTCEQAGTCASLEYLNPTDARCADAGTDAGPRCVDNAATVLYCGTLFAVHCGTPYYATGSKCTLGASNLYGCALGANCTVTNTCVGSSVFDECGSTDLLHYRLQCDYEGYDCSETPDGSLIGCLMGNETYPCSTLDTSCSPDGTSVRVCDGYDYSLYDCASLSGTCSNKGGGAICARPADKCTPFDASVNTCSGNVVSLCVGGQPQTFDCSSIGLTCTGASGSGHCG